MLEVYPDTMATNVVSRNKRSRYTIAKFEEGYFSRC